MPQCFLLVTSQWHGHEKGKENVEGPIVEKQGGRLNKQIDHWPGFSDQWLDIGYSLIRVSSVGRQEITDFFLFVGNSLDDLQKLSFKQENNQKIKSTKWYEVNKTVGS